MRRFRDRDFLRTTEGFFFCVVGPFHPPNRVISYLKYVPTRLGKWGRGKKRFKRAMRSYTIPNLLETFKRLEKDFPHYLFYSPFYNILMTAVPLKYMVKHYKPEEKLARLFEAQRLDLLQKKLKRLVSYLAEKSNVPLESFGVTGSILLNIHNLRFSDLDVTVYGLKNSAAVKDALKAAYYLRTSGFRRFEDDALRTWCLNKAGLYPLTYEEAREIYNRKWNIGLFEGTQFSVHPVKVEEEVGEEYGDKIYNSVGSVVLGAVVRENTDSIYLPAIYGVEEVKVVKGPQVRDVEEVVSYEGLYSDLAEPGETILVKGKLEQVRDKKTGRTYHRVLVGSPEGKGTEYVKII